MGLDFEVSFAQAEHSKTNHFLWPARLCKTLSFSRTTSACIPSCPAMTVDCTSELSWEWWWGARRTRVGDGGGMERSAGDEQLPNLVLISLWHQPCWPLPCLFPGTALGLFDVSSSDALQLKRALQSSPTGTPTLRLGVCFISTPPC